jgi:hypothetical protein
MKMMGAGEWETPRKNAGELLAAGGPFLMHQRIKR